MNCHLLGFSFCQNGLQSEGLRIFVKTGQLFIKIKIYHHHNEQDFEVCAIQSAIKTSHLIIVTYKLDARQQCNVHC
jgi:hypothetical protein